MISTYLSADFRLTIAFHFSVKYALKYGMARSNSDYPQIEVRVSEDFVPPESKLASLDEESVFKIICQKEYTGASDFPRFKHSELGWKHKDGPKNQTPFYGLI